MSIAVSGLTKKYNGNAVVNGVTLEFRRNEITFVTGTSGAGKSTLLYLIGLLEKESAGSIIYRGKDICAFSEREKAEFRAKTIGFMFQDSNLLSGFTVDENLSYQLELSGKRGESDKIDEVLKELGILNLKSRKIETLSGGERQRAVIAGSVLKEAEIILADEPAGDLDEANSKAVMELLQKIKKGRIIIVVSHDAELARLYADRVIKISDGKVIADRYLRESDSEGSPSMPKGRGNAGKLRARNIFRMSLGNIRKRLGSFLSICVSLSFALASLLAIAVLNVALATMTTSMAKNYLETDLAIVSKTTSRVFVERAPIKTEDLAARVSLDGFAQITPVYEAPLYLYTEDKFEQAECRQIILNSFYEERIMSLDVEGEFPKDKYQFIISEKAREALGVEIGDAVLLGTGDGHHLELLIVGVNRTVTFDKHNYCYLAGEAVKELLEMKYRNRDLVAIQNAEHLGGKTQTTAIKSRLGIADGSEEIIAGSAPTAGEIMISSFLFPHFLRSINGEYASIGEEELLKGEVGAEILEEFFSAEFALDANDLHFVRVSGIFLSEELLVKAGEEGSEKYYEALPKKLELFAKEAGALEELKDNLQDDEFLVIIHSEHLRGTILKSTLGMQAAVILLSFILLILSVALINTYVKLNVRERFYDIGLLKAMGARKGTIFRIFWCDFLILSIICTVLGVTLAFFLKLLLPIFSEHLAIIRLEFPLWLVLASFLFSIFISSLASLLPLLKATRLSSVEAIRRR